MVGSKQAPEHRFRYRILKLVANRPRAHSLEGIVAAANLRLMGAYSKYVNESADSAAVRHYHPCRNCFVRMDEMWWRQGEDDGSLLSQMTKDAAEAGAAVRHYHTTHCFILFEALSEWMKCGDSEARTTGVCFRK